MDEDYNLRSRRDKEDQDKLLPDDPLLPDDEEDPLFPSDDDNEACDVEDCKNKLPTKLCIPCDKHFCPFHLPTVSRRRSHGICYFLLTFNSDINDNCSLKVYIF